MGRNQKNLGEVWSENGRIDFNELDHPRDQKNKTLRPVLQLPRGAGVELLRAQHWFLEAFETVSILFPALSLFIFEILLESSMYFVSLILVSSCFS